MAYKLRYLGEFASRNGTLYQVEIHQKSESGFDSIGGLDFPHDEPLEIEWQAVGIEEPLQGSIATLKVISPNDRAYIDLYTIEPGAIRLDVYREGSIYWSGCLDPEFYEEPYETVDGYEVTLTFSDFGVLARLKFSLSGLPTIKSVILDALTRAGLNHIGLDESLISTTVPGFPSGGTLSRLSVRCDNFTDEDGEVNTLHEVISGLLTPLALKMVQRSGMIRLYDLNGLYHSGATVRVCWNGIRQTLGVAKVANNVRVTFSPYANASLMSSEDLSYGGHYDTDMYNLASTPGPDGYWSYYPNYSTLPSGDWDYNLVNFTIFTSPHGKGLAQLGDGARYFHILPMVGGPQESTGVAWGFHTGGHGPLSSGLPRKILNETRYDDPRLVYMTNRVYLPRLSEEDRPRYKIRLSVEMLLDSRYNPFCDSGNGYNEDVRFDEFKIWTGWAFVPVTVTMYDNDGTALCHYDNKAIAKSSSTCCGEWAGSWIDGSGAYGDAWLEYYDPEDLKNSAGIQGWQANRHCIGRPDIGARGSGSFQMYESFKRRGNGEYLPYPDCGGWLEVRVYAGVMCFDYGEGAYDGEASAWYPQKWMRENLYGKVRWHLYKTPEVTVVRNNLLFEDSDLKDVEYHGYLNRFAKDELNIDTIYGTSEKSCPTAKGIIIDSASGLMIKKLKRGGQTQHPERLLIGTLCSQMATRHTTLSGEAEIMGGGVTKLTEACQGEKVFWLTEDVQDLQSDTSNIVITELSPDEYDGIEDV